MVHQMAKEAAVSWNFGLNDVNLVFEAKMFKKKALKTDPFLSHGLGAYLK